MQIEPVDPADDDVIQACHAVDAAAVAADDPHGEPPVSLSMLKVRLTPGYGGEPSEAWYAPVNGAPGPVAGWYRIQLPDLENQDRAFLTLAVHPSLRRRGLGRELIAHARQRATAVGRTFFDGWALQGTAGDAFARSLGAEPGFVDARRIVDVRAAPAGRFAELKEGAARHATGYSLTSWTGRTPEERLGQVADVINAMNDAPREEGWWEDDIWDAERVRTRSQRVLHRTDVRGYAVAALHDATGEMAGLTHVEVDPEQPEWGYQGLTAVTRGHRGHRLGLLTKATMLEWLATAEPQIERILTGNAASNQHMIAVNETLGYELYPPGWQFCEMDVAAAADA